MRKASVISWCFLVAALLATTPALAGPGVAPARLLSSQGVGPVRFGLAKRDAVAELTRLLGKPSSWGANTGCGPRYSEVEWGEFVAEFRLDTFSGYRYLKGGWPLGTPGSPRRLSSSGSLGPYLATAKGISLGSTLGQLRAVYGHLRFVGIDKWEPANGLVFVVDTTREPEPPSSQVVEVKFGTCGDF